MRFVSRTILCLMVLAGLAILVFGRRGGSAAPPGRTVVTYWEKWSGKEAQQMQAIVDEFNRTVGAEKNIYVQYMSITQVDRKTLISTAAGVPPDIAGLWDYNLVPFASRDALEPLDDLAREFGLEADSVKPIYRKICTYNGKLWAMVSTPAINALHFNRHVFIKSAGPVRAAGLDPFDHPRTTGELSRYADAVTVRDPSTNRLLRAGHLPMEPNWYINVLPYFFGGRLFDSETSSYTFTDPGTIRAYEWMQSFPKRLGADAISQFDLNSLDFGSPTSPFIAVRVAMVLQGPWMANYTFNLRPPMSEVIVPKSVEMLLPRAARQYNYEWAVCPFPPERVEQGEICYASADLLVIPRGAKHKREAFEFIAYLQRQDVMERLCSLHCKNSPLASATDDFIRRHPNPYISVFERLALSPNAARVIQTLSAQEVGDDQLQTVQGIYLQRFDASTGMKGLQERATAKHAQAERRRLLRQPAPAEGAR